MEVRQISKKRYKEILKAIVGRGLNHRLPKTKNIKSIVVKGRELILVDDEPVIINVGGIYIPYIGSIDHFEGYGSVVVDKGAVKYIANGADVMRPGIVSYTSFKANDVVVVKVEEYGNVIAVGLALVDSDMLPRMVKGKVVKNLHHIGDAVWRAGKSI